MVPVVTRPAVAAEPPAPAGAAPYNVGEHTRQVLRGFLGYSTERIDALMRERVVDGPAGG